MSQLAFRCNIITALYAVTLPAHVMQEQSLLVAMELHSGHGKHCK